MNKYRQSVDAIKEKCYYIDMLQRYYDSKIDEFLVPNKVLVVYGPRQVGKTTLIDNYLDSLDKSIRVYKSTGENIRLQQVLESSDFSQIIPYFSSYDLVVIDEAQRIENIGQGLKIVVDQIKNIKVIATGSSSFDLSNKIGEPLVGRQNIFRLYPLSVLELKAQFGNAYVHENLENLLVYGSYPEVIKYESFEEKRNYLQQVRDAYLYKDILELENIKNSRKITDLLRLIAFQIGDEVSLEELGNKLSMSKNTVARYLDLLEKSFVIVKVDGLGRNPRKSITKMSRYYFLDNGIRNSLIGNFNPFDQREDEGQLWENFLVVERLKKQAYTPIYSNNYFWRTYDQKEIDWVEEREGRLFGFEFKWKKHVSKNKFYWIESNPDEAVFELINKDNYLDFVS